MDDGRRSKATRRRSRLLSRGPGSHNGELHRRGGARCPVKWITVCGGCGPKAFDGGLLLGGESSVEEVGSCGSWLVCVCVGGVSVMEAGRVAVKEASGHVRRVLEGALLAEINVVH